LRRLAREVHYKDFGLAAPACCDSFARPLLSSLGRPTPQGGGQPRAVAAGQNAAAVLGLRGTDSETRINTEFRRYALLCAGMEELPSSLVLVAAGFLLAAFFLVVTLE
jgi:hypothetical protein